MGIALALGANGATAAPITIGAGGANPFEVNPLYFIPPSSGNPTPIGLEGPGDGVDVVVPPGAFLISACGVGGGCELSITLQLITPVFQNPQRPADSVNPQTPQGTPTPAVPFVADSTWTVQNLSGAPISDAWLLFTSVEVGGSYPIVGMALDQFVFDILSISDGADVGYYGGLRLGTLAAGESKALTIRYIVTGDLPDSGGSLVLPPLGVSGLVVPEPQTAGLLGLGLALFGLARRRSCV